MVEKRNLNLYLEPEFFNQFLMIADYLSCSKQRLLVSDLAVAFVILLMFAIFRSHADLVLAYSWLFILGYVLVTKRILALTHLFLATLIAVIWLNYAKDYYGYI